MFTFLRRVFTLTPAIAALKERVEQLESDVEFLAADHKKLRGRVTGAERKANVSQSEEHPPADAPGGGAPADTGYRVRTLPEAALGRRRLRGF